ncbi:MAG: hypothetical protein NDI84_06790 [Steroidobacteraceae bacterium]|nr:hypothetical protein [Steroidobacteraceae bacterium]
MLPNFAFQTLAKAIAIWAAILAFAICNGALRDLVLVDAIGQVQARFLSGIVLCVAILAVAALAAPWFGALAPRFRWYLGGLWLVLTLGFEIAVGYAQHHSWQRLLDAYTLQGGNLWPLVLLTTFIAPWAGARIRGVT